MKRVAFIGSIICSKCVNGKSSDCSVNGHVFLIENQTDRKQYTFVKDNLFEDLFRMCNGLGAKVIIDGDLFPFSSIIKINVFKVIRKGSSNISQTTPTASQNVSALEKELSQFMAEVNVMNEKYQNDLNETLLQSEEIDKLMNQLQAEVEQTNIRRSKYGNDYGFSQKAQRVYFNKDFYDSINVKQAPAESTQESYDRYYRKQFEDYYNRNNIDPRDRYKFPD